MLVVATVGAAAATGLPLARSSPSSLFPFYSSTEHYEYECTTQGAAAADRTVPPPGGFHQLTS